MMIVWKRKTFYMSGYWASNLDNYVDGVMNKKTSAVLLFDGKSGLGKTTLSGQTACYIHNKLKSKEYMGDKAPDFNLDCLTWTPDKFIERLKVAKKGDIIMLDESMIVSNRSTMSEINMMVIVMMSLIRSKQIFVIFNINSIFDMDKNLPLHRADVLVHLYGEDDRFAARGRYMVIPAAKGRLKMLYIMGKKYYDYSKGKPVFRDKFNDFFPYNEKEYEKRKQRDIEDYFNEKKKTPNSKAVVRCKCILKILHTEDDQSTKQLSDRFKIPLRTVQNYLK